MHTSAARFPAILCSLLLAFTMGGCSPQPLGSPAGDPPAAAKQQAPAPQDNGTSRSQKKDRKPLPVVDLPADFPSEIPLHDGRLTQASTMAGTDGAGTAYWSLHIRTGDATAAMHDVRKAMAGAGLAETTWTEIGRLVSGRFETEKYQAGVQSAGDIDGDVLLYTVMAK